MSTAARRHHAAGPQSTRPISAKAPPLRRSSAGDKIARVPQSKVVRAPWDPPLRAPWDEPDDSDTETAESPPRRATAPPGSVALPSNPAKAKASPRVFPSDSSPREGPSKSSPRIASRANAVTDAAQGEEKHLRHPPGSARAKSKSSLNSSSSASTSGTDPGLVRPAAAAASELQALGESLGKRPGSIVRTASNVGHSIGAEFTSTELHDPKTRTGVQVAAQPKRMRPSPRPSSSAGNAEGLRRPPPPHEDPSVQVCKFDFSVFDFLKHEALRSPRATCPSSLESRVMEDRKKPSSTVSTAASSSSSGVHARNSQNGFPEGPPDVGNCRISRSAAPRVIADGSDSGDSEMWESY